MNSVQTYNHELKKLINKLLENNSAYKCIFDICNYIELLSYLALQRKPTRCE